jgi:hypothetical protein
MALSAQTTRPVRPAILVTASGEDGGVILLDGKQGQIATSATIDASGKTQGGIVEVTAGTVALLNTNITADGGDTGGTIHIGGEWQGGGDLRQAREVIIGVGSKLSATGNTGGEIVVWSTDATSFYGSADTNGTIQGGRIELSSLGKLDWSGMEFAPITPGVGGTLLIDPKDIIVTDTPPSSLSLAKKLASGSTVALQSSLSLADNESFGLGLALDGDRLAVGAPGEGVSTIPGTVYLFDGVGTDFAGLTLQKKLTNGTNVTTGTLSVSNGDYFGWDVDIDAGRLVVGASWGDGFNNSLATSGEVFLFSFDDLNNGYQNLTWQGTIGSGYTGAKDVNMSGFLDSVDRFGSGVSIDGNRLAVGAHGDDNGGSGAGAVYLYTFTDNLFTGANLEAIIGSGYTNTTTRKDVNMAGLVDAGDIFGVRVALDGNLLAVSAPWDDGFTNSSSVGAVYLFSFTNSVFDGANLESIIGNGYADAGRNDLDLTGLLDSNDFFGGGLDLAGTTLYIGALGDDGAGASGTTNYGAVYLVNNVGTSPTLDGIMGIGYADGGRNDIDVGASGLNLGLDATDGLGYGLAADSDRLAVGAYFDDTNGNNRGAVYLFNGVGTDFSGLTLKNKLADGSSIFEPITLSVATGDNFGSDVALDIANDRFVIGVPGDDSSCSSCGAVYMFSGIQDSNFTGLTLVQKITNGTTMPVNAVTGGDTTFDLNSGDTFGRAVDYHNGILAVGADGTDTTAGAGDNKGAVYLFNSDFSDAAVIKDSFGAITLNAGDQFGEKLAIYEDSGTLKLAASAFRRDLTFSNQGEVYLFSGDSTSLSTVGLDLAVSNGWNDGLANSPSTVSAGSTDGFFGVSVALDGLRCVSCPGWRLSGYWYF